MTQDLIGLTKSSQSDNCSKELFLKGCAGKLTAEEREYYITHCLSAGEKEIGKPLFEMNDEEKLRFRVASYNRTKGVLTGYDCKKCLNKGDYMIVDNNTEVFVMCDCWNIRKSLRAMEESGLGNLLKLYTFENYICEEDWQKEVFDKAKQFTQEKSNKWFVFLGESGAGKSHICTAISSKLLKSGYTFKYMAWVDESTEIKQYATDGEKYKSKIDELKRVQVLYIDDFFKSENLTKPTPADIKLANEILNYRYNRARMSPEKCVTIISSERTIRQLMEYDKAVAGRIIEMSKPYLLQMLGIEKNYRLKGL